MKSKIIKSILFSTIGVLSTSAVTPIVLSSCSKKYIPVQNVELKERILMLDLVESHKLKATIIPKNATNKNVTWSSSDESVVTVDQNGNVKAISEGNATITITTEDGNKTTTCEITVAKNLIHVTSVKLDQSIVHYCLTTDTPNRQLTATILPEDATNKNVVWSSSNESVVHINFYGKNIIYFGATSVGIATITVTTLDGLFTDTCKIIVSE